MRYRAGGDEHGARDAISQLRKSRPRRQMRHAPRHGPVAGEHAELDTNPLVRARIATWRAIACVGSMNCGKQCGEKYQRLGIRELKNQPVEKDSPAAHGFRFGRRDR